MVTLFSAGNELPAAIRQKTVVPAGHKRRAVRQRRTECGLNAAPVRKYAGFHVAPELSHAPGAVDLIANSHRGQGARAAICHEDRCVASYTIIATMSASSVRIDRLFKGDVGRVVGADHRASALGFKRGGDTVGGLLEVPPVINRRETLQVKAPRGI